MSDINDGGSAFPIVETNAYGDPITKHIGLSVRDYFAAKAMQALIAKCSTASDWKSLPNESYSIADAMIAERSKP